MGGSSETGRASQTPLFRFRDQTQLRVLARQRIEQLNGFARRQLAARFAQKLPRAAGLLRKEQTFPTAARVAQADQAGGNHFGVVHAPSNRRGVKFRQIAHVMMGDRALPAIRPTSAAHRHDWPMALAR